MIWIFLLLTIAACAQTADSNNDARLNSEINKEIDTVQWANDIATKYIILDGHVDLPYRLKIKNFRLEKEYLGIPISSEDGDFDYERAKKGGLDAPFMSIYIPSNIEIKDAKNYADQLIQMIERIIEEHPTYFAAASTPGEIDNNFQRGLISLPLGMENGSPIGNDLGNVDYFHQRGIRYITLTHAKDNQICDSSYDSAETWGGLSPFGRKVIERMNKTGIMIDVSHISDKTFFQVMELSTAPVIASHSSCRKFTPGFQRNMSDEMIALMGKKGGVIQINFGSSFLDGRYTKRRDSILSILNSDLAARGLTLEDKKAEPIIEAFKKAHPGLYSDVQMVANHIDHVVKIAGIDHVGLGSDFDGVGDSLPVGLKDVSQYPNLIYELLKRGYSESDIAKILYSNVFRVWKQVEKVAVQNKKQ
jgi:membrane dipeptidase